MLYSYIPNFNSRLRFHYTVTQGNLSLISSTSPPNYVLYCMVHYITIPSFFYVCITFYFNFIAGLTAISNVRNILGTLCHIYVYSL